MPERLYILLILLGTSIMVQAQQLSLDLGLGTNMYNGDLSHKSYFFDGCHTHLAYTGGITYHYNDMWKFQLQYLQSKVSGSDHVSSKSYFQQRNLSFFSDIKELSVSTAFHFAKPAYLKLGRFSPFLEMGFGVFMFDPMTIYKGQVYALQPMGTEGQGLPNSGVAPYDLIETSVLLGAGITYKVSKKLHFSLKAIGRLTSTDYIDDVSGSYYDLNQLALFKGASSAKLAYRGDEMSNDLPESITGQQRGNSKNKDGYLVYQFTISYLLGSQSANEAK